MNKKSISSKLPAPASQQTAEESARVQQRATKSKAEFDKNIRRVGRELLARQKQDDMVALCGINFYSCSPHDRARGNQWTHCHRCGNALRYYETYEQAKANLRECKRE